MSKRDELVAKWRAAAEHKQYDLAGEYFLAAMEAGADDLDKIAPGSGDVWRGLARSAHDLIVSINRIVGLSHV